MIFKKSLFRYLPLLLLALIFFGVFYFRLYSYLSFETLKQHREYLSQLTNQYYALAALSFSFIYTVAVAISIPGAVFLTLAGGFLFGLVWGTIYVIFSATLGATLLFLAVNTALGKWLENRAGRWVKKMEQGFKRNAFNYLLTLRLIPIFPFWLVNIVPALLNVPLRTFIAATFIGIIPGSFVYVSVGNGLSHIFDKGETPNLGIIFTPSILVPLVGLAMLALLPILYKHFKEKYDEKNN
ncbi:MAG: TVP38/TMEM64 family protein [Candidatus Berkiella sp.]